MVKLNEYPAFRISYLRIEKSQLAVQLAEHNRNMSDLLEQGNYEVVSATVQDSASEIAIIVVLQRRVVN